MHQVSAIGFDLFDTLITMHRLQPREALARLMRSLQEQGLAVTEPAFMPVYREAARQGVARARRNGRETHNRYWISSALRQLGYAIEPHDPRIAEAVEAYFSAFLDYASLIPGTRHMLTSLECRYRLGLLSNFTHGPAARAMLARLGLSDFFEVIVISGEVGYRKPHWRVFQALQQQFGLPAQQIAFVGDDLDADVAGARRAGLQPIWMTYAHLQNHAPAAPSPASDSLSVPTIASWDHLLSLLDRG